MVTDFETSLSLVPDLRHRVRRLGGFRQSFEKAIGEISARYGFVFLVDDRKLAGAFLDWAEAFEGERENARNSKLDRRDFVVYSGGLMLKQLLCVAPVTTKERGRSAASVPPDPFGAIVGFWPEGFLYTYYCLMVIRAILESDFDETVVLAHSFEDLRIWQSFKENVGDDPSRAVPFLDLFLGGKPNWTLPYSLLNRSAMREAAALAFRGKN